MEASMKQVSQALTTANPSSVNTNVCFFHLSFLKKSISIETNSESIVTIEYSYENNHRTITYKIVEWFTTYSITSRSDATSTKWNIECHTIRENLQNKIHTIQLKDIIFYFLSLSLFLFCFFCNSDTTRFSSFVQIVRFDKEKKTSKTTITNNAIIIIIVDLV